MYIIYKSDSSVVLLRWRQSAYRNTVTYMLLCLTAIDSLKVKLLDLMDLSAAFIHYALFSNHIDISAVRFDLYNNNCLMRFKCLDSWWLWRKSTPTKLATFWRLFLSDFIFTDSTKESSRICSTQRSTAMNFWSVIPRLLDTVQFLTDNKR